MQSHVDASGAGHLQQEYVEEYTVLRQRQCVRPLAKITSLASIVRRMPISAKCKETTGIQSLRFTPMLVNVASHLLIYYQDLERTDGLIIDVVMSPCISYSHRRHRLKLRMNFLQQGLCFVIVQRTSCLKLHLVHFPHRPRSPPLFRPRQGIRDESG